ncbi:hypothetical protein ACIBBB_03605 [Streptomyces sp. NPDC051217]|uniref:hypothetical protein n=1 Tax=Streptomyces sp. NPDC051217 TaxID=3365644 RepID=UPI0037ACC612
MPNTLTTGRYAAVFISLGTLVNLLLSDVDSAFVVPDAVIVAALAIGAVLPGERAVPVLTSSFGLASGVFTVASFSYFVRGEIGGVVFFALVCMVMTVLFAWRGNLPTRSEPHVGQPTTPAHH